MLPLALNFSEPTTQLLLLPHFGSHIHHLASGVPFQHSPILATLPRILSLIALTANGHCHIFSVCILQPQKLTGPCPKPHCSLPLVFLRERANLPRQPTNSL
jgi:hypothetical protein